MALRAGETMVVTTTDLYKGSWDEIFSLIDSNTTDPNGRSKWIYSSFPDAIAQDKNSYPLIVVNPIETTDSEPITITFGTKTFAMRTVIEVYSTNNEELDDVVDSVFAAIESNESTLAVQNIYNFVLSSSLPDTIERGKIRVHRKTLEWDFEFQKVS